MFVSKSNPPNTAGKARSDTQWPTMDLYEGDVASSFLDTAESFTILKLFFLIAKYTFLYKSKKRNHQKVNLKVIFY